MLIRVPQDWELPESAATPERDYRLRPRREFLRTAALGAAGLATGAVAPGRLLATTAGFPTRVNPDTAIRRSSRPPTN
jgi:hypothetical protein